MRIVLYDRESADNLLTVLRLLDVEYRCEQIASNPGVKEGVTIYRVEVGSFTPREIDKDGSSR
jgi:hypothetical protein